MFDNEQSLHLLKKEYISISGIEEWQVQICEKWYDIFGFCSGIVIAVYFFNEPIWIPFSNSSQWYFKYGLHVFLTVLYIFFFVWIVPTPLTPKLTRVVTWKYCLLFLGLGSSMSHSLQPQGYRVESQAGEKNFFAFPECLEHFWGPPCLLFSRY